ncbi:CRISPR-associated endonuclease Cas2 [Leptolyngbya sp. NM1-A1]
MSDILEGYGKRVQYSVFELVLAKSKYDDMKRILSRYVNFEEDSLRFYPISQHTLEQVEIWGGVPLTQMQKSIIV